jgi:hypothetical protein
MNYTDTQWIKIADSLLLREVLKSHSYGFTQSVGEFTPVDSGLVQNGAGIWGGDNVGPDLFGILMGEPVIADLLIFAEEL